TVDVFRRDRSGLLAKRNLSLPSDVGATLPQENLNSDRTEGIDLTLTHRNRFGKLHYKIKGVFSFARTQNRYVEAAKAGNSYENWRNRTNNRYNNILWGYGAAEQYQSYDAMVNSPTFVNYGSVVGDYSYEDYNGDGVISELDEHPVGFTGHPLIHYVLNIGIKYQDFDLNILIQGARLANVSYIEQLYEPLWFNSSALTQFLDRWHPADPLADPYDPKTKWISGYYSYTGTLPKTNSTFNIQNSA